MGDTVKATDELCNFLDTFYSDIDGWLELTDIYSSCGKYVGSRFHVTILEEQGWLN